MAAEILKGYNDLQQELDRARSNLKGLNDNIRRIIGRDPSTGNEPYGAGGGRPGSIGGGGGGVGAGSGNFEAKKRNSLGFDANAPGRGRDPERRFSDSSAKRRAIGETKSVFSRLSGPPNREVEYEKPRLFSRVIKEQPSKEDIVAAQGTDPQSRARNRRIFGSLLGTLQKFSQEESKLKSKEEKKAQIERKLEEQEKVERENMRKEKQCLFTDRKRQQLEIRALEAKVSKLRDLEAWEEAKTPLRNFIRTKTHPPIYYLPKWMDDVSQRNLDEWQHEYQVLLDQKRQEAMESIEAIEERFRAEVKALEENSNRTWNNTNEDNRNNGNNAGSGSKHDRNEVPEEDDEDDDPHNSYHDDEQSDVPEGPALPASMAPSFKITIHNVEIKQEKPEPSLSPQIVRLLSSDERVGSLKEEKTPDDVTSPVIALGSNPAGSLTSSGILSHGENFQITFKAKPDGN